MQLFEGEKTNFTYNICEGSSRLFSVKVAVVLSSPMRINPVLVANLPSKV